MKPRWCRLVLGFVAGGLAPALVAGCQATGSAGPCMSAGGPASEAQVSGRTMIVVDIDETLSHTDYFDLVFRTGREDSRPLSGAQEALTRLAADYDIIYLTSRPTYLFQDTRGWLVANGFPDAPLYTAGELIELVSQRRYKTRHLARLRQKYPNALIGIGDRSSDGLAYQAHGMIPVIVNPADDCEFNHRDIVLRGWSDVEAFFAANAGFLQEPESIRSAASAGRFVLRLPEMVRLVRHDDVDDRHGRGKLNRALVRAFPHLRAHANHQAGGARALHDNCSLAEAVGFVEQRWPDARLVGIRLGSTGEKSVVQARMLQGDECIVAVLDARTGQPLHMETHPVDAGLAGIAVQSSEGRISLADALERASKQVRGQPYSIELTREYRRPTYEVSLLCRRGFWEVDIDVATGRLQEVDREWRLVPLKSY